MIFADNDSISQKHIAEFFALLGGGVKEPGWNQDQGRARLEVVLSDRGDCLGSFIQ